MLNIKYSARETQRKNSILLGEFKEDKDSLFILKIDVLGLAKKTKNQKPRYIAIGIFENQALELVVFLGVQEVKISAY